MQQYKYQDQPLVKNWLGEAATDEVKALQQSNN